MFKMILAAVVALSFSTFAFADDHSAPAAEGAAAEKVDAGKKGMEKTKKMAKKHASKMGKDAKDMKEAGEAKKEEHAH
jgi:Skp family chaperone for outer membrane proteins